MSTYSDTEKYNYQADIYISTNGNDKWSGKLAAPLLNKTDGPLKTLDEARKRVREINKDKIVVCIREGHYFLNKTVVFELEDGGCDEKAIIYEAYPEEVPVLTSGIQITNWEKVLEDIEGIPEHAKGYIWKAEIPKELDNVLTMYDKDIQLIRSHGDFFMPAKEIDYERVDSLNVAKEEERKLLRRIDFEKGQLRQWENIHDVEFRLMPVPWTMNLLPLERIDMKNNVAWLSTEATAPAWAKSKGIRVENVIDYLDEAGKWCVDTVNRVIYYWPIGDEPGENIYVPSLQEFIRVQGQTNYYEAVDVPVTNLHFKGLTFKYGKADRTVKDYKGWGIQHDWEMFDKGTALLRFRGAENCSVTGCHFHTASGTAIRLDLHCQKITVANNLFDNIGCMGILLCGYGPGSKDVNKENIISNNIITRCGEVIWHGHAIFIWQSGSNVIKNNKIHHSARKAIGLCGVRITILRNRDHEFDEASKTIRWSEIDPIIDMEAEEAQRYLPFLHSRNNLVTNNEVYKVLEKIYDGSAINISGAGEGNRIKNNYVHHISSYDASSAMRVDDWQRGTTFANNIIYKTNVCAIVRKNYNHIINNIMVDANCREGYVRFASYPGEKAAYGSLIKNNIFYDSGDEVDFYGSGYLVSSEASLAKHCRIDNNVYYVAEDSKDALKHLEQYHYIGRDRNSLVTNPLFTSIEDGDFTLSPESPALKLGFQPINQTNIGITEEFPTRLRKLEYNQVDNDEYARGKDDTKENYEWW